VEHAEVIVEVTVVPGAMVEQSSVTVTETTISTPMQETDGTTGVTYGGGGVVTGYGTLVDGPPGTTVVELLVNPLGLIDPDG